MLKTLRETMTKRLTFIFLACINVEYYSKSFRKAKIIVFKKTKKKTITFLLKSTNQLLY